MRFLRTLSVGDRFRPAHPGQESLNRKKMSRETVYRILKVYSQSPHLAISHPEDRPESDIFSLGPKTPVLLPKEFDPTEEEIIRFLNPQGNKRVVGYRVLWDGKTDISHMLSPAMMAAMKLMVAFGKKQYDPRDLKRLFVDHYDRFLGRPSKMDGEHAFILIKRRLVNLGLLEEVVDVAPKTRAVTDANLQNLI